MKNADEADAIAVVDLGFGDAGKGLMVDALARRRRNADRATLVVRFNGGAQAGHNVVTQDGRHHTFAQFGAASFLPNVRTHLAAEVVVHPTALLVEAEHLARAGVRDPLARLTIDPEARVVTPMQQAAGRLRELARGAARHGSCGVGIGETVNDSLAGRGLRMRDLARPNLRARLEALQKDKWTELEEARAALSADERAKSELSFLDDRALVDAWLDRIRLVVDRVRLRDEAWIGEASRRGERVILEGAQGVLLDEHHGAAPHTSWGRCTFAPAEDIAARQGFALVRLGVVRMYMVRHGAGPLPTHAPALDVLPEPHNEEGPWQGAVRRGWPDPFLLRYALAAARGADALAVTHLDMRERVREWRVPTTSTGPFGERGGYENLDWPNDEAVRASFAEWTGLPIAFTSSGPTADDVKSY